MIACSIVVLTRNRGEFLPRTLESLITHDGPSREILLFDNGSTDNTAEIAKRFDVRYFSTPDDGLAQMRQKGVEEAAADIVVMCDDDCLPQSGWLAVIQRRFEIDPKLAILGGKIINIGFEGGSQKGAGRFGVNGLIEPCEPEDASYFGAANLALRRSAVLASGGFDPFFVCAYEEADLRQSLEAHGYHAGFEPAAAVEHHNVSATQRARWRLYHPDIMRIYFFLKHKRPRGLAWFGFLKNEAIIQARILVKWKHLSVWQRVCRVSSTIFMLPWLIVKS